MMNELPADWPLRERSRMIRCRPHVWHVQTVGQGPDVLLLHGAAASGHSFHRLLPYLPGYRLILPDLPGQGYTRAGGHMRLGLDAMADDLGSLCEDQDWRPVAIIGHSAGAAVALRMAEIMPRPPRAVVGINAALGPFDGFAGWLFPKLARAMATGPFAAAVVTKLSSSRPQVARLLAGMGSPLDAEGVDMYRRLVSRTRHIEGTLGMMAQWQLEPLLERLPQIAVQTLLMTAAGDKAVPTRVSAEAAARMPRATHLALPHWGHLVHEEAPEAVAPHIVQFLHDNQDAVSAVKARRPS
ncbi:alpha/beta fold hydrolase [Roseibaca sp. V10]|uniref:Alpha/beta fold hydrolase n=1 Tax=Roseinatronobacter domitianus TaxID=2940293 RepID=A0ABT0LXQ9_9RHOB|nr:alpha/beta fold hydrolase BchO [Roseibaca domitiana]MCL1627208.1 alpha/beta fold hydrolase [Roseibaca domitiana]